MTVHLSGNSKFGTVELPFQSGDVIEEWNLGQIAPHTAICVGLTGLTFVRCNLLNCDLPAGSVVDGCLQSQQSFCTNLHQDWVPFGLTVCDANCSHVIDTDEIRVDGVLVDTIYHYADTRVD